MKRYLLTLKLPSLPKQKRQSPQIAKAANRFVARQPAWALAATIHRILIGASVSGSFVQSISEGPRCIGQNPVLMATSHSS
jgi:hypothetical protein